jgi:hypothetical protein
MKYNNLYRDCFSSIAKHIKAKIPDATIFYENDNDTRRPLTYIEVRIDGPDIDEIANQQYRLFVDVDLLIVDEKSDSLFKIRNLMGKCAESLREDVNLLDENGVCYGNLSTAKPFGGTEKINVVYYGSPDKDKNILQATVATRLHSLLL